MMPLGTMKGAGRRILLHSLVAACLWGSGARAGEPASSSEVRVELGGFRAPRFEITAISAWTLRQGELEVGPTVMRFGLLDVLQIGTRFALNLLGALNAEAKWTIYDEQHLGVGIDAGLLRFDPTLVGIDDDFALWAFPVALRASARPGEAFRVHAAVEFLSTRSEVEASDAVLRIQRYLGPVAKLAARVGFEWRLSDIIGLVAELEIPLVLHRSTFRYDGEDDAADFLRGTLAAQFVLSSFNVRVGGGWGPSFLGKSGPFPVLELALRIY
jgi:hypothetical protein